MVRQDYNFLSDDELLTLIRLDDALAFKALFSRYYNSLCKFTSIYVNDNALAEEIIADVFIKLWEARAKSNIEKVKSYLFTAARNQSFTLLKKKPLKVTYCEHLEEYSEVLSDERSPLSIMRSRETQQEIIKLIDTLPIRQREVLLMSRLSDISNEEIALVLNLSLKTVQSTLYEAIRELRSKIFRKEQSSDI
ncbi:RNA polymerase sigma-70 factor [Desertivirga arenae]|uniref:RNA polymerase sigma-70 factor n=1 Tax=Desertivirga arenae TaxID=2810309 RepID=UPI001A97652F|nr:RNA polymerase sigma-70 factor [Pedobacter sp. SYSU D00823]